VEFKNVTLKYRPNTPAVLKHLTFVVEPGSKVGVVGRTGAGKSTVCISLSRIVELFEGIIEIDGIDIAKLDL
jgi:ABC-type multidrug transport system fused ATPase/permease subunit